MHLTFWDREAASHRYTAIIRAGRTASFITNDDGSFTIVTID